MVYIKRSKRGSDTVMGYEGRPVPAQGYGTGFMEALGGEKGIMALPWKAVPDKWGGRSLDPVTQKAIDEPVYDILGLTQGERDGVEEAVDDMITKRLAKAKNVMPRSGAPKVERRTR